MNQLSNSKVSNSIYFINTQIAKISGNVCSVLTPFNNSLIFPRTPFKGSFKGPSRTRLKEWTLFTSSLQQRWCSRDGVLERFELDDMDESDRAVDGVDGVVCRELDDALVTDL